MYGEDNEILGYFTHLCSVTENYEDSGLEVSTD